MCDPFNTSIEAALWDECLDLDPFMAEHYATNAQHELDRALTASPLDQLRIAHIRCLLSNYHGLAAIAQLPNDSDFEDAIVVKREEVVASENTAFIHPDRAALMLTDDDEIMTSSSSSPSSPRGEPRFADHRNNVVAGDEGSRSCSPESSVESISRADDLDGHVHDQQQHIDQDLGRGMHQQVTQQQIHQQQIHQQQIHQQQLFQQQLFSSSSFSNRSTSNSSNSNRFTSIKSTSNKSTNNSSFSNSSLNNSSISNRPRHQPTILLRSR